MELKIPPVVVFLVCFSIIVGVDYVVPDCRFELVYKDMLSGVSFVVGIFFGVLGVLTFRNSKTTIDPSKPQKTSTLVTSGVYSYTRNPMYLGLGFLLFSMVIHYANPLGILALVIFIWYMTRFQIKPEERTMSNKFGKDYHEYTNKVRRWI